MNADRFFSIAYYMVMAVYGGFIVWMLTDLFPNFFMSPALGITAVCLFGLLMIFRPQSDGKGGATGKQE